MRRRLPLLMAMILPVAGILLPALAMAQPQDRLPVGEPLAPMQTFSPRQTLQNFLLQSDAVARFYRDVFAQDPSPANKDHLAALERRATRALDLSELPSSSRNDDGLAAARDLYDTLSRIDLPAVTGIPGEAQVADKPKLHWNIPNTPITIARIQQGPREGHYLFTAATVAQARDWSRQVIGLPPKRPMPLPGLTTAREIHAGLFLPASWIDSWPAWTRVIFLDQAIWKWLAMLALLVAAILLFAAARSALRGIRSRLAGRPVLAGGLGLGLPLVLIVLIDWVDYVGDEVIGATYGIGQAFETGAALVSYFAIAWLAWLLPNLSAEAAIASPLVRDRSLDAHLLRLLARLLAIVLIAVVVLHAAASLGIPVLGLVAGASVSGLVLGLAAQDALKNLIASIMIFIDKPYRVGERIKVMKLAGSVEDIGLRSTRLRLNNGHQASIPNDRMSTSEIENTGRREFISNQFTLRLRNDTGAERLQRAMDIASELLQDRPELDPDNPPAVLFTGFGDWSLDISVSYAVRPPKRKVFDAVNQAFYMALLRRLGEEGIALATPTNLTYLAGDRERPVSITVAGVSPQPAPVSAASAASQ